MTVSRETSRRVEPATARGRLGDARPPGAHRRCLYAADTPLLLTFVQQLSRLLAFPITSKSRSGFTAVNARGGTSGGAMSARLVSEGVFHVKQATVGRRITDEQPRLGEMRSSSYHLEHPAVDRPDASDAHCRSLPARDDRRLAESGSAAARAKDNHLHPGAWHSHLSRAAIRRSDGR